MPSELQDRIAVAISGAPFPTANSRRKALAVMKAMREPTKVMIDGAYAAHDAYEGAPSPKAWCGLSSAFRAAIDAEITLAEGGSRDRD